MESRQSNRKRKLDRKDTVRRHNEDMLMLHFSEDRSKPEVS